MDISKELEYTIIGLIDLAERDVRSTAGEIARHMELPEELIKKIFQKLSKAQIVRSIKGKGGGYELNIPLEKLTIGYLKRAVTGESFVVQCLEDKSSCSRIDICRIHDGMGKFQLMWNNFLDSVSIRELVSGV
ncbi:MAG: Rrf2 family transcriptional regulator [Spirochaetia bacterium]|jgi:Rrf2 family protein|nr:Rrf2 family transcriptional regulator [Spirochaetia bacterium]